VPGSTSDVCIPLLTTANATPPISIHSLQISEGGLLIIDSGSGSFSVATSLINQGGIELYGAALSAGSIEMTDPSNFGNILAYSSSNANTSSITSPAFSNATGTVYVGAGVTLRLTDNPVQLQNGTLSGGNWEVDDTGLLIIPSDITQITGQPGDNGAFYTVLTITNRGSLQDTSGKNPLATLTSLGSFTALGVPSLTLNDLTCQGSFSVGSLTVTGTLTLESGCSAGAGSLTVNGTLTVPSGARASVSSLLSATSVLVESGGTLSPSGTVQCSITNNGTVSPGIVTVTGNYSQAAGAALTEQFGSYSTLNVKQNATLSGALNIEVNPKHPPASGAHYTALTAGSLSGSFTSHTAGFTLTISANSIQVTKQ
jgi:hypothetical protein